VYIFAYYSRSPYRATWKNGKPWPQDICLHSFSPKHRLLACSIKVGESLVKLVTCSDTPRHQLDVQKNCKAVFCPCILMDHWQVLDNDLAVNIGSLGGVSSIQKVSTTHSDIYLMSWAFLFISTASNKHQGKDGQVTRLSAIPATPLLASLFTY